MRKYSIIITYHNRGEFIPGMLKCLSDMWDAIKNIDISFEVVIVDDRSSESLSVYGYDPMFPLKIINLSGSNEYRSCTAARNAGIKASSGDYIIMTDPEVRYAPDLLIKHDAVNNRAGTYVLTVPIMCSINESKSIIKDDNYKKDPWDTLDPQNHKHEIARAEQNSWDDNMFSSFPRSVINRSGMFNEGFKSWGFEGIEFVHRSRLNLKNIQWCFHLNHDAPRDTALARKEYDEVLTARK